VQMSTDFDRAGMRLGKTRGKKKEVTLRPCCRAPNMQMN